MQLGELPFGSNIKIPERREGGTYELADYTLGCLNNFDVGTAGLIRKDIHSFCRFGGNAKYAGSDLDERMTEIYNSYPDELKELIIPSTIPLSCIPSNAPHGRSLPLWRSCCQTSPIKTGNKISRPVLANPRKPTISE